MRTAGALPDFIAWWGGDQRGTWPKKPGPIPSTADRPLITCGIWQKDERLFDFKSPSFITSISSGWEAYHRIAQSVIEASRDWLQIHSHSRLSAPTLLEFYTLKQQSGASNVCSRLLISLSLSLLPHLAVMLLDTTESTSELGWTTYPDTGVSGRREVNVLPSCGRSRWEAAQMCCTHVTHGYVLSVRTY